MQEIINKPGIVITDGNINKTSKVKNYIEKNKIKQFSIRYVENPSDNFAELNRQLQELENECKGIDPPKEKPKQEGLRECPYKYRINANTVLEAYTEDDLNLLKKWRNVYDE